MHKSRGKSAKSNSNASQQRRGGGGGNSGKTGPHIKLRWKLTAPGGPNTVYHTGCVIGNVLYVHGGIEHKDSTEPSYKSFRLDLTSGIWEEIRIDGAPAMSHHASVAIEDRYFMLIGGWNGSRRCSDIFVFDTVEKTWRQAITSEFPTGAGLSSHSATLLHNGDILIVGREGSLRTQRRNGQAFLCRGSIKKNSWEYSVAGMAVDSRSGHTANLIGQTLALFGGRDDKQLELHNGFKGPYSSGKSQCSIITYLHSLCQTMRPMVKPPSGRKQHVAAAGDTSLLIHGGETFDGRFRVPVGQIMMLQLKPTIQWFFLGESGLCRAGHILCSTESKILIHGGFSGKGVIHGDTYQLEVLT